MAMSGCLHGLWEHIFNGKTFGAYTCISNSTDSLAILQFCREFPRKISFYSDSAESAAEVSFSLIIKIYFFVVQMPIITRFDWLELDKFTVDK